MCSFFHFHGPTNILDWSIMIRIEIDSPKLSAIAITYENPILFIRLMSELNGYVEEKKTNHNMNRERAAAVMISKWQAPGNRYHFASFSVVAVNPGISTAQ